MRSKKKLVLEQLQRKLEPFEALEKVIAPENGWIHTIRKSLNMTLQQLGKKVGMTRQGVKKVEEREANGTITINALREIGEALEMNLIYGFSSKYDSLDQMVTKKAEEVATKIVLRTHHNMQLENQGNSEKQIREAIDDLAQEIKRNMRKSLWD